MLSTFWKHEYSNFGYHNVFRLDYERQKRKLTCNSRGTDLIVICFRKAVIIMKVVAFSDFLASIFLSQRDE